MEVWGNKFKVIQYKLILQKIRAIINPHFGVYNLL